MVKEKTESLVDKKINKYLAKLKNKNRDIRIDAADELGMYFDEKVVDALITATNDKDEMVRAHVVSSLVKLASDFSAKIEPTLIKLLTSETNLAANFEIIEYMPNSANSEFIRPAIEVMNRYDNTHFMKNTTSLYLKELFKTLECHEYKDILLTEIFLGNAHPVFKEALQKCK